MEQTILAKQWQLTKIRWNNERVQITIGSHDGVLVGSMLAFYLNDQSSNPTEFLKYYYIKLLEKKENKRKRYS